MAKKKENEPTEFEDEIIEELSEENESFSEETSKDNAFSNFEAFLNSSNIGSAETGAFTPNNFSEEPEEAKEDVGNAFDGESFLPKAGSENNSSQSGSPDYSAFDIPEKQTPAADKNNSSAKDSPFDISNKTLQPLKDNKTDENAKDSVSDLFLKSLEQEHTPFDPTIAFQPVHNDPAKDEVSKSEVPLEVPEPSKDSKEPVIDFEKTASALSKCKGFCKRAMKMYGFILQTKNEYIISANVPKNATEAGEHLSLSEIAETSEEYFEEIRSARKNMYAVMYYLEVLCGSDILDLIQFKSIYLDAKKIYCMLDELSGCGKPASLKKD